MKATHAILVILGGSVLLTGLIAMDPDTNKPAAPLTAEQKAQKKRDKAIYIATELCKEWTKENSKMAVDEFTRDWEVTGRKLKAGHYLVGAEFRTRGLGLLARTQCELAESGENWSMVSARARLVE